MKKIVRLFTFLLGLQILGVAAPTEVNGAPFNLQSSYAIQNPWPSGYQAEVFLTNRTSNPTTNWTATFNLTPGQTVSTLWNGNFTQSGQVITVTNPSWIGGGVIPRGGSTSFGMIVQNPQHGPTVLNALAAVANGSAPPVVPVAPKLKLIVVSPTNTNNYSVSWNSVANAISYTLQQAATSSFSNPVTIQQGTLLSHSFTNQVNGTYYYRVNASNASGTSPFSNVRSVNINVPIALTAPVLAVISNPSGLGQYAVSWGSVPNAQTYVLQESSSQNFSNPQTIVSSAATSYNVFGHAVGTYYYRVIAVAGTTTSVPSNIEATVVSQTPPPITAPYLSSYWESWNTTDALSTIVNMKVDVISVAFATFTSTGTNTFSVTGIDCDQATLTQFISLVHGAGKKVKLSLGGATYPLSGLLRSTAAAEGMARSIAQFVQANSLDGVDIDIEDYPAVNLQVALIQNLRQLLGPSALISYTPKTPAMTTQPYTDVIRQAHQYLTEISFMAYDYGPGYTYNQDVTAMLAEGIPASKIVIGLMPGRDDLRILTSLADITAAAQYAVANHLGGLMFWDLNRDHENLTGLGSDAATNTAWPILHK